MNRFLDFALTLVAALALSQVAHAQVYTTYYPTYAAPTTTYYQPAPVSTYYAPAPTTVYYAPPVTTTYYRPYRPLIGGTVSGWRYNYPARTYVYPAQVAYYPGW